jgi:hypothetical protein
VRVARFVNAAKPLETLDLFGNLRPYAATATTASWRTQVTVTGPAGSVYALYMGTAFYRTIPASGLENGRVFHNITTVFGNLLLEPGPGFLLVGSGAIPAAGNVQVNVDFFTQALGLTETETDVQAFIVPPAGPARLSNRYLIDLNE